MDESHLSCFTSLIFTIVSTVVPYKNVLSCIIAKIWGYVYKMFGIYFAILLHLDENSAKIKFLNNISS